MKTFLSATLLGFALAVAAGSSIAQGTQSDAAANDCFRKHAQLMDKPAVKNPRDCWSTHRHLS